MGVETGWLLSVLLSTRMEVACRRPSAGGADAGGSTGLLGWCLQGQLCPHWIIYLPRWMLGAGVWSTRTDDVFCHCISMALVLTRLRVCGCRSKLGLAML